MESPRKLTSTKTHIIDAVLCIGFFIFMYFVVVPHVQSHDPKMLLLWGGLTSACMTGVFWFCIHMCRVVYWFQRDSQRK